MTFKELRLRRALPQNALADTIGVKKTTISNWETGISRPSIQHRRALADALGISLDELFQIFPSFLQPPRRPPKTGPDH